MDGITPLRISEVVTSPSALTGTPFDDEIAALELWLANLAKSAPGKQKNPLVQKVAQKNQARLAQLREQAAAIGPAPTPTPASLQMPRLGSALGDPVFASARLGDQRVGVSDLKSIHLGR